MAQKIQRIPREDDSGRREADRARLLERVAAGLAHEGKNPLQNMVLHVQLMAAGAQMEKHPAALLVSCDSRLLNDLVAHALVAALELSRDGGTIEFKVHTPPARAVLELR